jgi:hypothetical protein
MSRIYVSVGAVLLLVLSEPSFAAKRMSNTKGLVKSHSSTAKSSGSLTSGSVNPSYSRDPYASGVNWPGKW